MLGWLLRRPPPTRAELKGIGKAQSCTLGRQNTDHTAQRFVWHHILPQVCGGQTVAANLVSLCDNCHYAVHAALYALAHNIELEVPPTTGQLQLARQGYDQAQAAGTVQKIPREAS
jgi:hypothetical protein